VIDPNPEFAASGWVVATDLADIGQPSDLRFFAVGLAEADEAVEAVLRYPGLAREDRRFAIRRLSQEEVSRLELRAQAVRPYVKLKSEMSRPGDANASLVRREPAAPDTEGVSNDSPYPSDSSLPAALQ